MRSAQSKEECVQCGPRSRGFIVKGEGTQKSGRQPEEDDLPRFLGVADVPELLRGESNFEHDVSMDRSHKRWGRIRTCALTCRHTTMIWTPCIPSAPNPCEAPGPYRYLKGASRGHTGVPASQGTGAMPGMPARQGTEPCRDSHKPRHRAMGAAHLDGVKPGFDFLILTACDRGGRERTGEAHPQSSTGSR